MVIEDECVFNVSAFEIRSLETRKQHLGKFDVFLNNFLWLHINETLVRSEKKIAASTLIGGCEIKLRSWKSILPREMSYSPFLLS